MSTLRLGNDLYHHSDGRAVPAIPGRSTDYLASSGVESPNPGALGWGGES